MNRLARTVRFARTAVPVALAFVAACGGETPEHDADATAATGTDAAASVPAVVLTPALKPGEAEAVTALAQPVAMALAQTLQQNLQAAMQQGGPVAAMEFCNVEALPLTQQVSDEQGFAVKRTSWRVRNPANAPDALEQAALVHFAEAFAASGGEIPGDYVQADPEGGFRYYKALPTAAPCVQCHGQPEQLGTGVADALARLYPDDRATGFAEGEIRGLLRVAIPAGVIDAPTR